MNLSFEIQGLPFLPNRNAKNSWQKHWKLSKLWKAKTQDAIWGSLKPGQAACFPFTKPNITLTRCSSAEPDYDGLVASFKHVMDGLISAGVIIDDKPSMLGVVKYEWSRVPPTRGCVKVEVECVEKTSALESNG